MKPFNKEEYNKLCAEFLGATYLTAYPENKDMKQDGLLWNFPKELTLGLYRNYSTSGLKFDSDYNWIMEVVDKIEKITAWVNIKGCLIDISTKISVSKPTKKEALVQAIWEYLNIYYKPTNNETATR